MRDSDKAYDEILKLMLTGKVKSGEEVNEKWLSEQLSLGRTPIREALTRLTQEGYITAIARKRRIYASLGFAETISLYNLRTALCPYLSKLLIQRITDEQIKSIEDFVDGFDSTEFSILEDLEFHRMVAACTRDKYLQEILRRLDILAAVATEQFVEALNIEMKDMYQDYRDILSALKERNGEKLLHVLEHHIPQYTLNE